MTTVQIVTIGTATVKMGVSHSPYIMVENISRDGNNMLVPFAYSRTKLDNLINVGFTVVDPLHLVTCPGCGALIEVGMMECDGCAQQFRDYLDEKRTNEYLARGG